MQKHWRATLAITLLGLGVAGASLLEARAIDLSTRPEASPITSVSDIQSGNLKPAAVGTNRMLESSGFKSLEYRPTAVAEIQDNNPTMEPVTLKPQPNNLTTALPAAKPAYLVFPVLVHDARDKAFSDLPIMMSAAVANQLSRKVSKSGYTVLNPIYAYDSLREKGLTTLYETIMRDYVEAGAPDEQDLTVLADQLSTKTQHVDWVIFVEAGFDTDHTRNPVGKREQALFSILDINPSQPNFFLNGAVRVFNVQDTATPLWAKAAKRRMTQDGFGNFTKSVYDDSDSVINFRHMSVEMARQMIGGLPMPARVMQPQVAGSVVPMNVTPEDQQASKSLQN